jgi:hypothetical protein
MPIILNRSARVVALAVLGLALSVLVSRPVAAADLLSSVSDSKMEAIFKSMDLDFTKSADHKWRVMLDDSRVVIILYNDGTDMQFYVAFGDTTVSAESMNKWNAAKRFSRAYSDSDKNPTLEWDVDYTGGITEDTIKASIKMFRNSLIKFKSFVQENRN